MGTDEILTAELGFEMFSRCSEKLFSSFFFRSSPLVWSTFNTSNCFFFYEHSDFFLIWQFYSFCYLAFFTSHSEQGTFFYARFHSYIMTVLFISEYPILLHIFQAACCRSYAYVFKLYFLFSKFVTPVHYLNICFSGIIVITNINVESTFPGKTPLDFHRSFLLLSIPLSSFFMASTMIYHYYYLLP